MATLGSLVVSLEANTAKLASDLGKANQMFESAMNKIGKVCGIARGALEGLVAAFTVQRIAAFAKGLIDAAATLETLHTTTGLSVTALSALSNEASIVGLSLDTAVGAFDKMQKLAFSAAGGNKAAAGAFAAIGISAAQVTAGLKDPDALLLLVAKHMQGFADDGNKTAIMMTLFGKGGAQMNELLQQLDKNGLKAATTNAAQAKQAEDFNRAMAGLVVTIKAAATTFVMDLLPAFDKVKVWLEWAAVFGGTAFLWLVALPKIAALAVTTVHGLAAAFNALNISLTSFNTVSSIAAAGFKVLGAAVIGFEIGTWMYNQFAIVRLVGAGMISFFEGMWIEIKYDWQIALSWMTDTLKSWAGSIGSVIAKVPGAIGEFGAKLAAVGENSGSNTAALIAARGAAKAKNQAIYDSFAADYAARNRPAAGAAAVADAADRPSIKPFNGAVTKLGGEGNDGIIKAMDERLKIITNAMKAEDAATKLANTQLEADYDHGNVGLADYSVQKNAILQKNFLVTQSLYDAEIGLAGTYVKQLQDKLAGQLEQQKTIDPTQAAQMVAKIRQTQAELDQATSKVVVLTDEKAVNATENLTKQVETTEQVIAKSEALAKTIIDVQIAYATMNGDTALANSLATEQQDALTKTRLLASGLTEDYKKLLAVEEDRRMRSSQTATDGMNRALIDYGKNLNDVAKSTASITTNLMQGMEDSIVSAITTGKLNFRTLINDMIAQLVRLYVQQTMMKPLLAMMTTGGSSGGGWMGALTSLVGGLAGGGASTGVSFTGDSSSLFDYGALAGNPTGAGMGISVARAAGGPTWSGGQPIMIGERGPELWVPPGMGNIVPNNQLNSGPATRPVNLTMNIQTSDADSFRRSETQVRAGLAKMMRRTTARDL